MDPTAREISEGTQREMAVFLDDWRVEKDVPGLSVAVTDVDEVVHATGFGARDVEARAPAGPDTRYPFASVTKVITATIVLQFVDSGDLGLDDEIREYVDDWANAPGEPITVRELLTHASGMPDDEGAHGTTSFPKTRRPVHWSLARTSDAISTGWPTSASWRRTGSCTAIRTTHSWAR